jgi:plasmid stabilization system protein ParE
MDFTVRWTARALRDVTRAAGYVRRQDPDAVGPATDPIIDKVASLAAFPYSGDIEDRSGAREIRVVPAGSYRIYFELDPDAKTVTVRAVRHVRQQDPDFSE